MAKLKKREDGRYQKSIIVGKKPTILGRFRPFLPLSPRCTAEKDDP